jgi:two-component sensor histidine kinase
VICVALATVARIALGALFGQPLTFATYFPAIVVAALFGGPLAGLLSIPLSIAAVWWAILAPAYEFAPLTPAQLANFGIFALSTLIIVWLAFKYRRLIAASENHERERQLLVRELEHRSKNALAVTISIIRQSLSDKEAATTVINRLKIVSDNQDLTDQSIDRSEDLKSLLEVCLIAPHGASRITLTGPGVTLPAPQSRGMRLIIHELSTNALKHGALLDPNGRVTVNWEIYNSVLIVDWCELDGPRVRTPEKFNFGSRLITRTLKQMNAEFEPKFAETGYCYKMKVPLSSV